MNRLFKLLFFFAALLCPATSLAAPDSTPDSTASVVFLRDPSNGGCNVAGGTMENCFESMSALSNLSTGWIWSTRNPTSASPLIVDIGPGEFGTFACSGDGYVSLRGAGREHTILRAAGSTGDAVSVQNCDNLSFMDIGFSGGRFGVHWVGRGSASWTNVDMTSTGEAGDSYPWSDECDSEVQEKSLHYIHGSRLRNAATASNFNYGFSTTCAESWIIGSEILVTIDAATGLFAAGVYMQFGAVVQTFGTPIRTHLINSLSYFREAVKELAAS